MCQEFVPYIARDRYVGPYKFDMHITDANAKNWYDSSPNQWMRERQWCIDTIKPGFTVLDCGAHHGLMTILFAIAAGPAGIVHAWEALPENAYVLARNAALNKCLNVVVHARGVGNARSRLPVSVNHGNVFVVGNDGPLMPTTGFIDIVRLDDDVDPLLKVDFLKIDVEGHELEALQGAVRILAARPFMMLELHNFMFKDKEGTVKEILQILSELNYSLWVDDFETAFDVGRTPDPIWIASLKHAQLYCAPA